MFWTLYQYIFNKNEKNNENKDNKINDSRFYYLSLLKENTDTGWSIHGLWPQYDEKNYPVYCKKVVFDNTKLEPILSNLEENWYSNKGTDEDFWKHEWEKHGSCVFSDIDELQYFSTALKLFFEAVDKTLPEKYYNQDKNTCLIPVDLNFNFINDNINKL